MTKLKIKSWLSRNFSFILFWFGFIVVVFSLIFVPFSRPAVASAYTSGLGGGYVFSAPYLYSSDEEKPVSLLADDFTFYSFFLGRGGTVSEDDGEYFGTSYGVTSLSSYSFPRSEIFYAGGKLGTNYTLFSGYSGFVRFAGSDNRSSFGARFGTENVTIYTPGSSSNALGSALDTAPSSFESDDFRYFCPGDSISQYFTDGHSYSLTFSCCLEEPPFSGASVQPIFSGSGLVWNSAGYFSCDTVTGAHWLRPSFIPSTLGLGGRTTIYFLITPTSFYDSTSKSYVYPFSDLAPEGVDPTPPGGSYQEGYDAGYSEGYNVGQEYGHSVGYSEGYTAGQKSASDDIYQDGYEAGQEAGYDAGQKVGYDSGYSEGFNKGQSQQLVNPASFFLLPVQSFLSTDLFGTFSLGDAFSIVMFVLVAVIFIKMFAGG